MLTIPVIFDSYRSLKDKTLKITFETSEVSPQQIGDLAQCQNQYGYLAFKVEPFTDTEKETIEALKTDFEDTGKTPGQRLRAVLYRNWEKSNDGYKTFFDYYNAKMETLIDHFKGKLD